MVRSRISLGVSSPLKEQRVVKGFLPRVSRILGFDG